PRQRYLKVRGKGRNGNKVISEPAYTLQTTPILKGAQRRLRPRQATDLKPVQCRGHSGRAAAGPGPQNRNTSVHAVLSRQAMRYFSTLLSSSSTPRPGPWGTRR